MHPSVIPHGPGPSHRIKRLAPELLAWCLCPISGSRQPNISLVSKLLSGPVSNAGSTPSLPPARDHLRLGRAALELCPGTNFIPHVSADVPVFVPSENPAGLPKCSLFQLHEIQYSFTHYNHIGIFCPRWKQIFFMKMCFNQKHI